jgi:transcriptional regulator of acetoin/glycerol metabolism
MVERLYLLKADTEVQASELPEEIFEPADGFGLIPCVDIPDVGVNLENVEAMTIRRAMQVENGNLTRVAEKLGISRPTLYRKIKQYDIPRS